MKWLIALVAVGVISYALLCAHSRSMRRAWMWNARISLSTAYQDYVKTGVIPNQSKNGRLHAYTNIVTIGGTNYSCAIALDESAFGGAGVLAITTNAICVWLENLKDPKIIGEDYWPPFFGGY